MRCGECHTVREALRKKNLDDRVRTLLAQMQVASREVEGSAAERSALRFRFVATRVWCGCAFVFFTLNPHDNKTPLLIVFGHGERYGFRRLSLDWDDEEMTRYYEAEKEGNALRFHDFAASHPRACSRAVHETFRMVLEILGSAAPPANVPGGTQHLDLIAAKCEAGMWQYVHAYNGTVEPQGRTTEHMHAFLQLLGYTTPEEFFADGDFCKRFRKLWAFAASICFLSQEAVARQCGTPGCETWLQSTACFKPNKEQLEAIGPEAAAATQDAQQSARGISPSGVLLHTFWDRHDLP